MILVDTSVWIEFFRGRPCSQADWLAAAISEEKDLCICGMILKEILQGIRDNSQFRRVKKSLTPLIYLPMTRRAYEMAADIYRSARSKGKSIRNTVDCVIAACAIEHQVPLLERDRDFHIIADHSKLKILTF